MQRTRRWIKAVPEVSAAKTNRNARAATHHGSLRMLPLCASLVALGLSATFGQVYAQAISLTSASPSYSLSGDQTVTAITVANGVTNGTITGSGYTLTYSGATSKFAIGGTAVNQTQSLNMSGLTNFVFDNPTQAFSVGGQITGGSSGSATGTLTLAADNNVITASSFGVANVTRSISATNSRNTGTLYLGQSNTINADTIMIGNDQNTATMAFNTGIAGGTLVLRGTDGTSPVSNWNIGTNQASNYVAATSTVDLSGGSLDALVTNLLIGQETGNTSTATAGTLIMSAGTLDATTITLGQRTGTSGAGAANGTLTINGAL
jgi:hypothetical protein